MLFDNLERAASEADEISRMKPLLDQLMVEAKLPADHSVTTLTYSLLFSSHQNLDGMLQGLRQRQQKRLLRFINHKAFLSKLAEMASTLFDPRFVHNRVMKSAIDRLEVVRKLKVGTKTTRKEVKKVVEVGKQEARQEYPSITITEDSKKPEEIIEEKTIKKKEVIPGSVENQKKARRIQESYSTKTKEKERMKKIVQDNKPKTADSQKTFRKTRESQVLSPPRPAPKGSDPKQKLNKASILRTGATISQSLSNEERVIQNLAFGCYYNPYQEKVEELEAHMLNEQKDQETKTRKLNLCRAIRKHARRAQLLGFKRKKMTVNLLKSQKAELARQWRNRRNEEFERVKLLCKSLQASRNSQRNMVEQRREIARSMNQDLQQKLQTTKQVWQHQLDEKMRRFKTNGIERHQRLGNNKTNDKMSSMGLLCELPLDELKTTLKQLRNQTIDQAAQRRAKKQVERNRELDKLEGMMRIIDKNRKIQEKQRMQK